MNPPSPPPPPSPKSPPPEPKEIKQTFYDDFKHLSKIMARAESAGHESP